MCKNFNDLDALEDQAGHRAWLSARGCKETKREEEITKAWGPAILSRLHRGSNIIRGKCLRKEYLPLGTFVDNANVPKHQKLEIFMFLISILEGPEVGNERGYLYKSFKMRVDV